MEPKISVTMPIEEYQRRAVGLRPKGVALLCIASFCCGIVVGTIQVSDDNDRVPEPVPVTQSVEPITGN